MRITCILLIALFYIYAVSGSPPNRSVGLIAGRSSGRTAPRFGVAGRSTSLDTNNKRRCSNSNVTVEVSILSPNIHLLRERRSIADMVSNLSNRVFETFSSGLEGAGRGLRTVGNQFHRGSDYVRNASLSTRVVGVLASDRLRRGSESLLSSFSGGESAEESNLVRTRRAAPRRQPIIPPNFQLPAGKLTLEEMLQFVKQHNAEVCLQRVICELSANSNIYGEDGIRFGTKLLNYRQVSNDDANKYKRASKIGNQYRGRPSVCSKKYPQSICGYDSMQLIAVGNTILN